MTTYVYKSTTGHPVNIDDFTITPNPGLQLKYPNDILDTYLGTSINRYDDGVLVSSDPEVPVMAKTNLLTGGSRIPALADAGISAGIESLVRDGARVGLVGDSITYTNTSVGVANNLLYYDNGYFGWALALLGLNPSIVYNGGVGGETTAMFADQLAAAIAAGCDVIFYMGGTNNADGADMVRLALADYESAYETCRQEGVFFYALTPIAKNADTATKAGRYRALAAKIMSRFSNRPDSHAADTQAAVYDYTANNWMTGYTYDGTHPNSLGGYYMGKAIYTATVARIDKPKNPVLAATNDDYRSTDAGSNQVLVNPMLTGTSGTKGAGCSGSVAASWSAVCTGAAVAVFSKEADPDGLGEIQVIAITASAAGEMTFYQALAPATFAVGDDLSATCEMVLDAGPTGLDNVKLEVLHSPTQKATWGAKTGNTTVVFDEGFSITPAIRPDVSVITGTTGAGQASIVMAFKTAGSATLRIKYPTLRV